MILQEPTIIFTDFSFQPPGGGENQNIRSSGFHEFFFQNKRFLHVDDVDNFSSFYCHVRVVTHPTTKLIAIRGDRLGRENKMIRLDFAGNFAV